jgi:hypothetical protein
MQLDKKLFIIYPGRFHPFHKGHKGVYQYLNTKYSGHDVYITSTDKVELPKSPFSFDDKKKMMTLTGIPINKIINVKQNYNLQNLIGKIPIDINRDSIIFAVSEKDMLEDPRFSKFTKKDGSLSYLQPLPKNINRLEPAINHGYIDTVPTTSFTVLGMPARSASQLRSQYLTLTPEKKKLFITDLFGKYDANVQKIMDDKLGSMQLTEQQIRVLKSIILRFINEDDNKVKNATHKANLALVVQRDAELESAEEKLDAAEEKLKNAGTPEEKDAIEASIKVAKKNIENKKSMLDAAKHQARA